MSSALALKTGAATSNIIIALRMEYVKAEGGVEVIGLMDLNKTNKW